MRDLMETKSHKAFKKFGSFLLSISGILLLLFIWEFSVRIGWISAKVFAPPSKVYTTFITKLTSAKPDGGTLPQHFIASLKLALIGFGGTSTIL